MHDRLMEFIDTRRNLRRVRVMTYAARPGSSFLRSLELEAKRGCRVATTSCQQVRRAECRYS